MNIDIIYSIGLHVNLRRSIAIIGSCKVLWERRKLFYKEKGAFNHTTEINLWTPEQNYYALGKYFILGTTAKDGYTANGYVRFDRIKLTSIYEYNNATKHLINEDNTIIFKITKRFIVIYGTHKYNRVSGGWATEYYDNIQDVHMAVDNKIQSQEYEKSIVIDLKHSTLGYSKFNTIGHNSIYFT
jgi:hypothetical protein